MTKSSAKSSIAVMTEVNIGTAKTQLSKLIHRAEAGEEIIIARAGKPVVRLVPVVEHEKRLLGMDEELFEVPEDFDDPLTEEELVSFEP